MARHTRTPQTEVLQVVSLKLTPALEKALGELSQEASDRTGWTVSNSAVIRALVSDAWQQPASWAVSELYPVIEGEIAGGRVWGSR